MPAASAPPTPTRLPWWRWPNLLALDAVAVALVWLEVFGKMSGARVTAVEYAALGVAVWVVYGADRLMDSRLPPDEGARHERHWFAARHAFWLVPLALVLAGAAGWWALHGMRQLVLAAGLQLAVGVGVYFAILAASRWRLTSLPMLLVVAPVMIGMLLFPLLIQILPLAMQGEGGSNPLLSQWWRLGGTAVLALVIYHAMRNQSPEGRPPWTLLRKIMGGFLFARGVALAPLMHFETGPQALWSAPVMLFGGLCALNSLGIRLWEHRDAGGAEGLRLEGRYPWLVLIVGGGALTEALAADAWTRPVMVAVAAGAGLLLVLNFLRSRVPAPVLLALADAVVLVCGVGALLALNRL